MQDPAVLKPRMFERIPWRYIVWKTWAGAALARAPATDAPGITILPGVSTIPFSKWAIGIRPLPGAAELEHTALLAQFLSKDRFIIKLLLVGAPAVDSILIEILGAPIVVKRRRLAVG